MSLTELEKIIKIIEKDIDEDKAWVFPGALSPGKALDKVRHFLKCPERVKINICYYWQPAHNFGRPDCYSDDLDSADVEIWVEDYCGDTKNIQGGSGCDREGYLYQFSWSAYKS